jgi:hypothetical protein
LACDAPAGVRCRIIGRPDRDGSFVSAGSDPKEVIVSSQRDLDRDEVIGKLKRVQQLKRRLLDADIDRNEDMYQFTERKLSEAELDAEMTIDEYKAKYKKR